MSKHPFRMYSTMIKRATIITFMGMGLVEVIAGSPTTAKIRSVEKMAELRSRGAGTISTTIIATMVGNVIGGLISPKYEAKGREHAEEAEAKTKSKESPEEDGPNSVKSQSKDKSSSNAESVSRKEEKVTADADNLPTKDSATSRVAEAKSLRRRNRTKIRTLRRRGPSSSRYMKGGATAIGTIGTTAIGAAVFNYFFAKTQAENKIKTDKEAKNKSKQDETSMNGSDDSSLKTKSEAVQVTADKPTTVLGQDNRQKLAGSL